VLSEFDAVREAEGRRAVHLDQPAAKRMRRDLVGTPQPAGVSSSGAETPGICSFM
jgi:hypothetical protein